jgi:8-hydroxy-5-deazaflavin:NADPH oxidoreductase
MEPGDHSVLGIVGAGRIGHAMARIALRAGREVVIANRRGPGSLTSMVETLGDGVTAGTVDDAAATATVVLAVPWPRLSDALHGLAWTTQVVIDTMNDFDASDLDGRTSSEVLAELVAPARVVKAGNTFAAEVLDADPHEAGGRRVIFVSGDDVTANAEVIALFEDAGFSAIDLGPLGTGGKLQQVRGPLAGVNLVRLP